MDAHGEAPIPQQGVGGAGHRGILSAETSHGLAKRHELSRNLIRIWAKKYEAGAIDEDAVTVDLVHGYEARIAAICNEFETHG